MADNSIDLVGYLLRKKRCLEGHCPECDTPRSSIETSPPQVHDWGVTVNYTCESCNQEWIEEFTLDDVIMVKRKEEAS